MGFQRRTKVVESGVNKLGSASSAPATSVSWAQAKRVTPLASRPAFLTRFRWEPSVLASRMPMGYGFMWPTSSRVASQVRETSSANSLDPVGVVNSVQVATLPLGQLLHRPRIGIRCVEDLTPEGRNCHDGATEAIRSTRFFALPATVPTGVRRSLAWGHPNEQQSAYGRPAGDDAGRRPALRCRTRFTQISNMRFAAPWVAVPV